MVKVPKGYRSKNVRDSRNSGGISRTRRPSGGLRTRPSGSGGLSGGSLGGGAQRQRGGCGMGLLIGLALVAFFLFSLFSGNTAFDTTTDSVTSGGTTATGGSDSEAEEEAYTLINFVLDDLQNEFWPDEFTEAGLTYEDAIVDVFESSVNTGGCGSASSAVGPFYCPADNTAYIDIEYMFILQQQLGAEGDFSQAYILAHEVGHHVQNLLGINAATRQAQSVVGQADANALSVDLELQADCFAGAWAASFAARGFLDEGDLEEGVNAASAVGDDAITGSSAQENFTHGSSAQRVEWFNTGFNEGTDACTTFDGEFSPG